MRIVAAGPELGVSVHRFARYTKRAHRGWRPRTRAWKPISRKPRPRSTRPRIPSSPRNRPERLETPSARGTLASESRPVGSGKVRLEMPACAGEPAADRLPRICGRLAKRRRIRLRPPRRHSQGGNRVQRCGSAPWERLPAPIAGATMPPGAWSASRQALRRRETQPFVALPCQPVLARTGTPREPGPRPGGFARYSGGLPSRNALARSPLSATPSEAGSRKTG